ncbi:hypothetical protein ACS0TY_006507 [Phlomoides rotata]
MWITWFTYVTILMLLQHISEVNRRNRQKLTCTHVAGRKAFTVRANEISEHELGGEPCDDIDFF